VRIYTRTGDDGTTGLLYGTRVSKSDPATEAYGSVDEAVAALGLARALTQDPENSTLILRLQRELFVAGADLATNPKGRAKLTPGVSLVTTEMVTALEDLIDRTVETQTFPRSERRPSRATGKYSGCSPKSVRGSSSTIACPPPSTWPAPPSDGRSAAPSPSGMRAAP